MQNAPRDQILAARLRFLGNSDQRHEGSATAGAFAGVLESRQ